VADGFRKAAASNVAGDSSGNSDDGEAAAVVLVVKALVDDAMRREHPERSFPGATGVEDLGRAVVGLFDTPGAALNGTRLVLAP
jgi:hypothetical protein